MNFVVFENKKGAFLQQIIHYLLSHTTDFVKCLQVLPNITVCGKFFDEEMHMFFPCFLTSISMLFS